jgi:hypothetical protein
MPLDQALAMCRAGRIENREYFISAVPTDGTVDLRFYVIESKRSRDALMIEATRNSGKSPLIVRHLTLYDNWTSLRGLSGAELMSARDRLATTKVKTADLAALARFQLYGGAGQRSDPSTPHRGTAADTK